MTRDLEETLREMGPEYRTVVDRLTAAHQPWRPAEAKPVAKASPHWGRMLGWSAGYLVAASLLVLVALGFLFRRESPVTNVYTVRVTDAANEYRLAYMRNDASVQEIIRTQNADGSWKNDFLTRQNAAALKDCRSAAAQIAYKKALRNLRTRGML